MGGEIHINSAVSKIETKNGKVIGVSTADGITFKADYFFSTMPVKDLINAISSEIPENASEAAKGLMYRDFRTAGLLVSKMKIKNETKIKTINNIVPDTWIYIQEDEVKLGRLQIFNNWSPYLVKDPLNTVWIGLEYFCFEGDEIWNMPEKDFTAMAAKELEQIGIIERADILDSCSVKVPKAYPAYFGTYDRFDEIRKFTDSFENLFLLGRNGTHRYNNMDHSMLTAMTAVDNIIEGIKTKDNIWNVNAEKEYHEEKK